MATRPAVLGIERSLTGRAWRWRGGNMELDGGIAGLEDDIATQLLLARGVPREDLTRHRNPSLRAFLPDPSIFNDMDAAAERLAEAVVGRETVTVYGDYDVDGATSAALLIRLLRMLGHEARHYIPDRLLEGYGPSGEALVRLGAEGSSLVVTVDCGSMAHEALAAAHDAGIDVIVVDHHKCAADLPRALALVNPNRLDESDEAAQHGHLAAVGVAFLLAVAVVRTLRRRGFFDPDEQKREETYQDAPEPADFTFRGGATLIFDMFTGNLRYTVRKRIIGETRLAAQRDFLLARASGTLGMAYSGAGEASREPFAMVHRGGS